MSVVDRLYAVLGYKLDPGSEVEREKYERGLNNAAAGVKKLATVAATAATAIVAGAGAFALFAQKVAQGQDDLAKWSRNADVAISTIQRLGFAQGIFGGTQDDIRNTFDLLNQKREEYQRGEGDFRLLGELGISFSGNAESIFNRLADRFEGLSNRRAQDLGQRLGLDPNTVQLLRQGSAAIAALGDEAETLGLVLGDKAARDSEDFNDSMLRTRSLINSLRDRVAAGLLPAMTDLSDRFREFLLANRAIIQIRLTQFLELAGNIMRVLLSIVRSLTNAFFKFADIMGSSERAVIAIASAVLALKVAGVAMSIALTTGFGAIGRAALIANAKILLLPALIVGAFALIAIVIEDIYQTIQGVDNTAINKIGESFYEWVTPLREASSIVDTIVTAIEIMIDLVQKAGEGLGKLAALIDISASDGTLLADTAEVGRNLGGFAADRFGAALDFFRGPDQPPVQLTGSADARIQQDVTVTIQPGVEVDAEALGRGIGRGATGGLDETVIFPRGASTPALVQ